MSASSPVKRFLMVGEGIWPWYMHATAAAIRQHGYETVEFHWANVFMREEEGKVEPTYRGFRHRVEERVGFGPLISKINNDLLITAEETQPDFVFFYNVRLVYRSTMLRLRQLLPHAIFGQYANDNPFSDTASRGYWRNFKRTIDCFDIHFAYRQANIPQYRNLGATKIYLLRSYYLPELDRAPSAESLNKEDHSDVLFAGHYENDGRLEILASIAESGIQLRLHGGGWESVLRDLPNSHPLASQYPAYPVVGDNYRRAIAGTKVALCFLSSLNQDTYTRRNFEIPAIGTAVLSEYSDDLCTLFEPNSEIALFRNPEEAVAMANRLVSDDNFRTRVASGGHERVTRDGHDVNSRMKIVIDAFENHG